MIDAAVLAGGKGTRMGGRDKALLELEGKSFLERILSQLQGFGTVYLSTGSEVVAPVGGVVPVADKSPGCGPMGGLYAVLEQCQAEWVFVISCDLPLFHRGLAGYLKEFTASDYDAVVTVTRDGRIHPLCGLYNRRIRDLLRKRIQQNNFRMVDLLEQIHVKYVHLGHTIYPDQLLYNVNTCGDYERVKKRAKNPAVIAICGEKKVGKTTLLTGLLPILGERGIRVSVIKHDGHDFTPDVPGTDSFRFQQAGAPDVAVYSHSRCMTVSQRAVTLEQLIDQFQDADLILVEGGKTSPYPKIQIMRKGLSEKLVCDPSTLIGICSDFPLSGSIPNVTRMDLDDYAGVCDRIQQCSGLMRNFHQPQHISSHL